MKFKGLKSWQRLVLIFSWTAYIKICISRTEFNDIEMHTVTVQIWITDSNPACISNFESEVQLLNRAAVDISVTNLKFIKFRPGRHITVFSVLEVHTETLNGSGFFCRNIYILLNLTIVYLIFLDLFLLVLWTGIRQNTHLHQIN